MAWLLTSLPVDAFSNLGYAGYDTYHISANCNAVLKSILQTIRTEDRCLRSYGISLNFVQNMEKKLIPILIYAKDDGTVELTIKILEILTTPLQFLLSECALRTNFCEYSLWQINNALLSTKAAFNEDRTTNVLIEFLKKNVKGDSNGLRSKEQCANIGSTLLLLRNILHVPESATLIGPGSPGYGELPGATTYALQNQIIWNIFSQGIDKILIKLMRAAEANKWSGAIVELVALLYRNQQKETLNKWLSIVTQATSPAPAPAPAPARAPPPPPPPPPSGSSDNVQSNTSCLQTGL